MGQNLEPYMESPILIQSHINATGRYFQSRSLEVMVVIL